MQSIFLNQSELFILLYNGNVSAAKALFKKEFYQYLTYYSPKELREFLHTLNLGIYYYILFHEQASLEDCCLKNQQNIDQAPLEASLLYETGIALIHQYGYCSEYLISRYKNPYIRHAVRHIHQNLTDILCLKHLAAHVGLSKNQLCALFKAETGCTIHQYLISRRIRIAKDLLLSSDMSLELIAQLCGFNSTSYFCTTFKREAGETALQFRKKNQ